MALLYAIDVSVLQKRQDGEGILILIFFVVLNFVGLFLLFICLFVLLTASVLVLKLILKEWWVYNKCLKSLDLSLGWTLRSGS